MGSAPMQALVDLFLTSSSTIPANDNAVAAFAVQYTENTFSSVDDHSSGICTFFIERQRTNRCQIIQGRIELY